MPRMYLPPSTPPAEPEPEPVEVVTDVEPEPADGGGGEEGEDSGADPVLVTEPAPLRPPAKKAAAKKTTGKRADRPAD